MDLDHSPPPGKLVNPHSREPSYDLRGIYRARARSRTHSANGLLLKCWPIACILNTTMAEQLSEPSPLLAAARLQVNPAVLLLDP